MAGLASSIFVVGALVSRLFAGKYIESIDEKDALWFIYGYVLLMI